MQQLSHIISKLGRPIMKIHTNTFNDQGTHGTHLDHAR